MGIVQDPVIVAGQPRQITVSSLLMQDTLASDGVKAATGENKVALFANPFRNGMEEALVIQPNGELDYLQRDPTSPTGWSQKLAYSGYPQVGVYEVVVIVHPVDLSVWALVVGPYVTHEDIRVRPMRLTSQTVNGVTTCSWEWLPLAIPFLSPTRAQLDHVSRLRVTYDGTIPHVIGIDGAGKGIVHIQPDFTNAASGQYFCWEHFAYSFTVGAPDTYQYATALMNGNPYLYILQGANLLVYEPNGTSTTVSFDVTDLVGVYQPPRGSGWILPSALYLEAGGNLTNVGFTAAGGMETKTPGLGLVTASLWMDANGMLHVYGQDSGKNLQVLHQNAWAQTQPVWSHATSPTGTTPALVGVHKSVAAFTLDPFPDLLPSELMLLEGVQAADAWCIGTQDVVSTRWLVEAVKLPPATSTPDVVTHYVSDITLADADGTPISSHPVSVSAESRTELICDGASYLIGPGYSAALTTNGLGKIRVALPAGTLTPPQLRVEAVGLEQGAQVQQAAGVHDYLSGTGTLASQKQPFDGGTLLKATEDGGKPVVKPGTSQADADAVAAGVSNAFNAVPGKQLTSRLFRGAGPAPRIHGFAVGTMPDGRIAYREFDNPEAMQSEIDAIRALPAYGGIWDDFLDFASDVWEGIKNGVVEVYNAFASTGIGKVFVWICGKIVELAEFVIDTVEAAVHVVEAVFRKIVEAIQKVIEWLKALFSFADIWDTKKALQGLNTQIMAVSKDVVDSFSVISKNWFKEQEENVKNYFSDAKARFTSTSSGDFQNAGQMPATSTGSVPTSQEIQSNPQATWMLDRFSAGSTTGLLERTPFTIPEDSPLVDGWNELLTILSTSSLIGDVTGAMGDVAVAAASIIDPANPNAGSATSVLDLLNAVENLALAALNGLDEVAAKIIDLISRLVASIGDLFSMPFPDSPLTALYAWLQGEAGVLTAEPLTLGNLLFLIAAFFVTVIYKLIFGVDNPPFPGGTIPAFPTWQSAADGALVSPEAIHQMQGWFGICGVLGSLVNLYGDLIILFGAEPSYSCYFSAASILLLGLSAVPLTIIGWTGKPQSGGAAVVALSQIALLVFKAMVLADSRASNTSPWAQNAFEKNRGPILIGLTGLARLLGSIFMDLEYQPIPYFWVVHMALCVSTFDAFFRVKISDTDPSFKWRIGITGGLNGVTSIAGFVMTTAAGFSFGPVINIPDKKLTGTVGVDFNTSITTHVAGGGSIFNSPLKYTMTNAGPYLTIGSTSGVITGTPQDVTTYTDVVITVTDSNAPPLSASETISIEIGKAPALHAERHRHHH